MAKRRAANAYVYSDGVVYGWVAGIPRPDAPLLAAAVAVVPDWAARYRDAALLQVTNNSKVWSYVVRPQIALETREVRFAGSFVPHGSTYGASRPISALTAEYRGPIEWAKKDLARRAKLPPTDPDALAFNVAYEREAPAEAFTRLDGPAGPVIYTGFTQRVGAYTLEHLHQIVAKGVADGMAIWKLRSGGPWTPSGLEVMVHDGRTALGLAFAPGSGLQTGKRTISLAKRLLTEYNEQAVWRVVVHELCHHYRDEVFAKNEVEPNEREALLQAVKARIAGKGHLVARRWEETLRTHDATFVRELGRVDPAIKSDAITGMVFTEYADQSLVADLTAKREARKASAASKVSWAPTDGRIYIDRLRSSGKFSVWWMPLTEGRWRPQQEKLWDGQMTELLKRLGPDWAKTAVTYSDTWPSHWDRPADLGGLVKLLTHVLGMFITEPA